MNLFFYLAIAADLIGRERPSHLVDLAYLYYLPFCHVFTSNDNLHKKLAPYFLRNDQTFVDGHELKKDLQKLDAHYASLSDEIKSGGLFSFAFYPPHEGNFLVSNLWDKYMAKDWRERRTKPSPQKSAEKSDEFLRNIKKFEDEAKVVPNDQKFNSDNADHMVIKRMVRATKGKWSRFSPEVLNRRKKADGTWEDVA